VLRLYKVLGIASLEDLEAAAKDDRIKKAKGLGAALQTKVLQNLAIAKGGEGRRHLHRAAALLEHAKAALKRTRPQLRHVTVAGDFRRGCELVADLAWWPRSRVPRRSRRRWIRRTFHATKAPPTHPCCGRCAGYKPLVAMAG
jgi:DNA polymerase (family 10)